MSIWTRAASEYIKDTRGPEGYKKIRDYYRYGYDHDETIDDNDLLGHNNVMRPEPCVSHDWDAYCSPEGHLYSGENIYESFKEDVKKKTIYVKLIATYKAYYQRAENIFGASSPMDNLLTEWISCQINYQALQAVDKLIFTLCEKYNCQYAKPGTEEAMHGPIIIRNGDVFFQGDMYMRFSHEDVIMYRPRASSHKKAEGEPYYYIYLFNRTPASYRVVEKYGPVTYDANFDVRAILFADFLEMVFGSEEAEKFEAEMAHFSDEMFEELGFQTNRLGNEKVFERLRGSHADKMCKFHYSHIKEINDKENYKKVYINDALFSKIKHHFDANCKILLGYRSFAISFLTSEWLFGQLSAISGADYTYIVAGYLKSIEQLLWDILLLRQQGKHIEKYNSIIGDKRINDNDTTLGAIVRFLREGSVDVLRQDFDNNDADRVKNYVIFYLSQWVKKTRNSYFHKHTLDVEDVQFIREQTYFIYLLILGSLDLSDDHIAQLMG